MVGAGWARRRTFTVVKGTLFAAQQRESRTKAAYTHPSAQIGCRLAERLLIFLEEQLDDAAQLVSREQVVEARGYAAHLLVLAEQFGKLLRT